MSRARLLLLAAPLLALAVYLGAFDGAFQWDDFNVIVDYAPVHTLSGWLADLKGGVRPLLKLSYALNWIADPAPWGFHLFNNLVHAANALLVFLLAERFLKRTSFADRSRYAALFLALLFAIHPVRTEAVTYISGRSVSLMALFYLGSLATWVIGRERGRPLLTHLASPLLFLCAALVRETAVTLPFALILWALCVEGARPREAVKAARSHLILLVALVFAAFIQSRVVVFFLQGLNDFEGSSLLLRQTHGVFHLLTRIFTPTGLNIDPDLAENVALTFTTGGEALILAALLAAGFFAARRKHPAGFCILWFFLQLAPTNSLIPRYDVASERHLYLAALGVEWGLFLLIAEYTAKRPKVAVAVAAALLFALGAATTARNRDYRSEIALWEDTARKSPDKARPHVNLGYAYLLAGRNGEAEREFRRALEIDPSHERAKENLRAVEWKKH